MEHTTYNFYCDESCHLLNDRKHYMILGYISITYNKIKKTKEDIKILREKHKNHHEIKWSNLNKWSYPLYADLIDYFFNSSNLSFRAIIVDKHKFIAERCDNDYDKFYYKMYYQLIYHKIDTSSYYNIYLDIKDDLSMHRINTFKEILNVQMGVIQKIQHVRSHEVDLLQLCDLIIGGISYKVNENEQTSTPKLRLINRIETTIGRKIEEQTTPYESKFNVFKIRL